MIPQSTIPQFLHRGDTIALVSPAGCIESDCLDRGLELAKEWGLQVIVGEHVLGRYKLFSGREEERLQDLQQVLDNPQIKAILCTRGGYGTAALIDKLNFDKFQEDPKWIVGFSDITVLLSHLQQNLNIASLHATMPQTYPMNMNNDQRAIDSLHRALFGLPLAYSSLSSHIKNRPGVAKAPLIGGNLSVLYSLRGTPTDINPAGKILFIEDLNEYDYHIDRMLQNMYRSGWFDSLAGLIIGAFTGTRVGAKSMEEDVWQTVDRYVSEAREKGVSYPVYYGFSAGHIEQQYALYMGVEAELEVKSAGLDHSSLRFLP